MRVIFLLTLLLASCSNTGKELTLADTLLIPTDVFPSGWNKISSQHEPDWGSRNVFMTQYNQQDIYLNLIYWFVYYDDIELASNFSSKYEGGIFYKGIQSDIQWLHVSNTALTTQNYDEYDLRCRDFIKNDTLLQQCSAHLRYSHCIIVLSSNVDGVYMTLPDFVNILNFADSKMSEFNTCQN